MSEEIIVTGKTVEEAMANAVAQYGSKNASYDIAEMPKKGFLGIGSSPAKIRVTINDEEELSLDDIVSSIKDMKVATNKGGSGDAKRPEKKQEVSKDEDFIALGMDAAWIPALKKLNIFTVDQLKQANPNKLLNDLGGMRKKLKLDVPAATLEVIQGWIGQ